MSISPVPASTLPPAAFSATQTPQRMRPVATRTAIETAPDAPAASAQASPHEKPFSFWDLVDVINPLQHIPVVSSIYRQITGDEIGSFARVAGGALFGGFAGAAFGVLNAAVAQNTGHDVGDTILSALTGGDMSEGPAAEAVDVAGEQSSPAPATPNNSKSGMAMRASAVDTGSLFDKTGPNNTEAEPSGPVPVIEVRPQARVAPAPEDTNLPPARDLAQLDAADLNNIVPGDADMPAAPQPVAKERVQQAMMDALLKMQAHQAEDDKQDPETGDRAS